MYTFTYSILLVCMQECEWLHHVLEFAYMCGRVCLWVFVVHRKISTSHLGFK